MKFQAHCFSFCYKLDDENYDDPEGAMWGLICTLNDEYLNLIKSDDLADHIKAMKLQLEKMIGKPIYVFNRQDSEYKVCICGEDDDEIEGGRPLKI